MEVDIEEFDDLIYDMAIELLEESGLLKRIAFSFKSDPDYLNPTQ